MQSIKFPIKKKEVILALGAESAGVFAVYYDGDIFVSENFGDLLNESNFLKYKKTIFEYLKKERIKPDIVLTDLHPLYKTTIFGEELAKKYKILRIKVQHHIAHIFSAVGDKLLPTTNYQLPTTFFGIAMDGTGYGLDGNIWGGEIFKFKIQSEKSRLRQCYGGQVKIMERIGNLEEQIMIGGDLAVREPARMIIAILAKTKNQKPNLKIIKSKEDIYKYVKKFYSRNDFELLYNQLEQNFNCRITTSTGRILDAVSVLLGFSGNERNYKHEAVKKLEKNSSKPYLLEPIIVPSVIASDQQERSNLLRMQDLNLKQVERLPRRSNNYIGTPHDDKRWILQTTPLLEYLIKNIHKDKRRLAATAQLYLAEGLCEIAKKQISSNKVQTIFCAGGMANNKIISSYLEKQGVYPHTQKAATVRPWMIDSLNSHKARYSQCHTRVGVGVYMSKKIPRGDEGIAVGQVVYYLLNKI